MTHSLKPSLPPNVQGILWMTLSMAAFALEDLFVKRAVQALPLSEVLVLCGLGAACGAMACRSPRCSCQPRPWTLEFEGSRPTT